MKEKVSFSKMKFIEICTKIIDIINTFFEDEDVFHNFSNFNNHKKIRLDNRSAMLFLSNGDAINYILNRKNLAHLLGIDTDYLLSTGIYNETNSYSILKKFVTNYDNSYKKYADGIIDLNKVISPYVNQKLSSFEKNIFININDCVFVCKYNNNRAYGTCDYPSMDYIIVQEKEGMYYVSILSNDENNDYLPISNQVFNSYEEFYDAFYKTLANQEITMLNGMNIKQGYQDPKKIWINISTRNNKLQLLDENARKFKCIPNVLNDCLYSQKIISENKMDNNQNNLLLSQLSTLIASRNLIDIDKLGFSKNDISNNLLEVINSYNDSLFLDASVDIDRSYTNVLEENEKLKIKLEESQKAYEKLNSKYNEVEKNYKDQDKELEKLKKKIENVRKALN